MADNSPTGGNGRRGSSEDEPTLKQYGEQWLENRVDLADRTVELYAWLWRRYIEPAFGDCPLESLAPPEIRTWNSVHAKEHPTTAAKAYRLLSSILRTAVDDEVITRNPCQIRGAAAERAPERPIATPSEVRQLAEAMPDRLGIAVLLAAWCQLRRGEVRGLRRRDIDLDQGTVSINETRTRAMSGRTVVKEPKTRAGRRTVAIPPNLMHPLRVHIDQFVEDGPDALILEATDRLLGCAWRKARSSIGRPDLRFHDLRHSGLTWAAETGASLAELMRRAGHASQTAALRYQHATDQARQGISERASGTFRCR